MINNKTLDDCPCTTLHGVGSKLAENLAKRGVHTVQDLLFHLPLRYQDRTRITPISDLRQGEHAVVEGVIHHCKVNRGKRVSLTCEIRDTRGSLTLRFFHFTVSQKNNLSVGTLLRCHGEVRRGQLGYEMVHPEYRQVVPGTILAMDETLTPIYPTTEGLSQQQIRRLTDQALQLSRQGYLLKEYLPQEILQQLNFPHLIDAIHYVHRPPPDVHQEKLQQGNHPMQQRLAFEELVAHQITLQRLRELTQRHGARKLPEKDNLAQQFLKNLPFALTNAQLRVIDEIYQDLEKPYPMLRLVQGDVGSGKTLVAAMAMLRAATHGLQAVLMAPTEILAEQHYHNFCKWFQPLGIHVAWLSGKLKAKPRREALAAINSGQALIIIGTHALFQQEIDFLKLALLVIDEQHRFGVDQRLALRGKGAKEGYFPHQLIMTATPIPRSLAMTAYADLDYSVIDELPPGRTPVTTVVLSNERREEVIARLRELCKHKRQAYWVCTLIEDSEILQCQAAEVTANVLREQLPELTIGLVHGRLKTEEKEQLMLQFKQGEIDLLVATTVIEVGVDVPNANLMVIENPERLGLAQLHQLRGRVGRGVDSSHCVLLYQAPLSQQAKQRLHIIRNSHSGFEIAEQDLAIRGPGEVLGTRQTGAMQFRIADIVRDTRLLPKIKQTTELLMKQYPKHCDLLVKRWLQHKEDYGSV